MLRSIFRPRTLLNVVCGVDRESTARARSRLEEYITAESRYVKLDIYHYTLQHLGRFSGQFRFTLLNNGWKWWEHLWAREHSVLRPFTKVNLTSNQHFTKTSSTLKNRASSTCKIMRPRANDITPKFCEYFELKPNFKSTAKFLRHHSWPLILYFHNSRSAHRFWPHAPWRSCGLFSFFFPSFYFATKLPTV